MTTYVLCKKLIEKGIYTTEDKKIDIKTKLDVFLITNRISEIEFAELINSINLLSTP